MMLALSERHDLESYPFTLLHAVNDQSSSTTRLSAYLRDSAYVGRRVIGLGKSTRRPLHLCRIAGIGERSYLEVLTYQNRYATVGMTLEVADKHVWQTPGISSGPSLKRIHEV